MTEYYLENVFNEHLNVLEIYIINHYKKMKGCELSKVKYNTPEISHKSKIQCPYYKEQITIMGSVRCLKEYDDPKWHSYLITAHYALSGDYPDDSSYEYAILFGEEQFKQIYNEIDILLNNSSECEINNILRCINIHRNNICIDNLKIKSKL